MASEKVRSPFVNRSMVKMIAGKERRK